MFSADAMALARLAIDSFCVPAVASASQQSAAWQQQGQRTSSVDPTRLITS
jgi:hypothetical protein